MLANTSKGLVVGIVALLLVAAQTPAETHWNIQSVDADGVGTWSGSYSITVTGVILNNPEDMLDPTPNYLPYTPENAWNIGAQWQIFVQSVDVRDHAGTACWMGQNYGNTWRKNSAFSYSDDEWIAEMNRLNYSNGDPATGHHFRKGDMVQVTINFAGFYGGKTNINENHDNNPVFDFTITLLGADYGMPAPDLITLAMVVNPDDGNPTTHEDIFDQTRLSGGEYFQGRYVRINGLTMVNSSGWGQEEWGARICTVTDGEGRIFKLRMPIGSMVDFGPVPTGQFDVIGIFNQESGSSSDGTFGYELYVTEVIPEPATITLLGLSALTLLRKRKR